MVSAYLRNGGSGGCLLVYSVYICNVNLYNDRKLGGQACVDLSGSLPHIKGYPKQNLKLW